MNNAQLAIFLEKYMMLLSKAIEDVKMELPQEMTVTSKNIFGNETYSVPAFDPLYTVLNYLDDDIELLKKNPDGENA